MRLLLITDTKIKFIFTTKHLENKYE